MKIAEQNIAAIQAFGYTESEARFLYIVATHSGYFIPRQFLAFTGAKWASDPRTLPRRSRAADMLPGASTQA